MTQEEILEYNKLCAEFLGAIYSEHAKAWGFGNARIEPNTLKFGNRLIKGAVWAERFEKELKFHSDWNWIMEVVEAIEKLEIPLQEKYKRGFLKNSTHGNINFDISYDNRKEFKGWTSAVSIELSHPYIYDSSNNEIRRFETKKEAVVQAINQFLIWYKKQTL